METTTLTASSALTTDDLRNLYLNRPRTLIRLDFGAWFCNGASIEDEILHNMNWKAGIPYVLNAGYNTEAGLTTKLLAFNDLYSD